MIANSYLSQKSLLESPNWLEIAFEEPHNVLSWAVIGSGWKEQVDNVLWHRVRNEDLTPDVDPIDYYRSRLLQRGESKNSVGFLTSAALENYSEIVLEKEGTRIRSVVTAGLGNAVCIGDDPFFFGSYGTINIFVQCSSSLDLSASLEAVSLIAEARTLAVLDSKVQSRVSRNIATGTGTDCIAFASPSRIPQTRYTGKHTLTGHLIGKAVYESVHQGILNWKESRTKTGEKL
ncbi:adenosylcobinamide amidohydrolase [Leptospira barantonii]|uniref:Adenosylcobinamide amidohydrolase n=1 Tax=Leptospira barantonii TaxID=2023184 RepID=A0ABX4NKL9_9LEPT|nr:adenosylcobinamide amidohydrolase [Leptospira barantonii]PJZ57371.1 adenosylcobinamide amidohydrolase [Leptospira barantonii]